MLTAEENAKIKVPCFDEGSDELRGIHELHVAHDVVEDNTEFLGATRTLLFDLLFLEFFDFVQGFYRLVHVGEDAVRAHVQSFLDVIRLAL